MSKELEINISLEQMVVGRSLFNREHGERPAKTY